MSHKTVNPESLPKPSGFAHGMLAGNTVFLGGQTALDKDMNIVAGGIVEQFTQAFSNVLTTLREAGGQPEDLVNVTIYLTDVDDVHGERARDRTDLAGNGRLAVPGDGGHRRDAAVAERGHDRDPGHRGHPRAVAAAAGP